MNNYVLYEDNEIKVEIEGNVHQFLKECSIPYFCLGQTESKALLGHAATRVLEDYPERAMDIVVSSNKVYIIEENKCPEFDEPFDYFERAGGIIANQEDFNHSLLEVTDKIQKAYEGEPFIFEIFPFPIFKVRGFFSYFQDGNIYVLMFAYKY